jgi:hypothetical protein
MVSAIIEQNWYAYVSEIEYPAIMASWIQSQLRKKQTKRNCGKN